MIISIWYVLLHLFFPLISHHLILHILPIYFSPHLPVGLIIYLRVLRLLVKRPHLSLLQVDVLYYHVFVATQPNLSFYEYLVQSLGSQSMGLL